MGKTDLKWKWNSRDGKEHITDRKPELKNYSCICMGDGPWTCDRRSSDWDGREPEAVRMCDACQFGITPTGA